MCPPRCCDGHDQILLPRFGRGDTNLRAAPRDPPASGTPALDGMPKKSRVFLIGANDAESAVGCLPNKSTDVRTSRSRAPRAAAAMYKPPGSC